MPELRTDFDSLADGDKITLYPEPDNPLHKRPVVVTFYSPNFYAEGGNATAGPDYYLGDVLRFCAGFTVEPPPKQTFGPLATHSPGCASRHGAECDCETLTTGAFR